MIVWVAMQNDFYSLKVKWFKFDNLNNTDLMWKDTLRDLELVRTDQSLKMVRQAYMVKLVHSWCNCFKGNCNLIHLNISVIIVDGYFIPFKSVTTGISFCIKALSRITIMIINIHCTLWGDSVVFRHFLKCTLWLPPVWVWSIYITVHRTVIMQVIVAQLPLPCSASHCDLSGFCVVILQS